MESMRLFSHLDYRAALKSEVDFRKKVNKKFTYEKLASAIGIQKPYLSKVFSEQAHFNSDQLHLACHYLRLNDEEENYLLLLLEFQRSGIASRRTLLSQKIKSIQTAKLDSQKYLNADFTETTSSADYTEFYLNPIAHLLLSFLHIPKIAKNPKSAANLMQVSLTQIEELLKLLKQLQLIDWDEKQKTFVILKKQLHLPKNSTLNDTYQAVMRIKSTELATRLPYDQKYQLAVTFVADENTKRQIHQDFLEFLKRTQEAVIQAPPEKAYQLNFDLLTWPAEFGSS